MMMIRYLFFELKFLQNASWPGPNFKAESPTRNKKMDKVLCHQVFEGASGARVANSDLLLVKLGPRKTRQFIPR